jgi:ABC-type nickel/cobalt efflux system permease component RcnA
VLTPPGDVGGSLISALAVGFLLGLRHALDADHVAAVSTFASGHRGPYAWCVVGGFWGIGHTGALLVAALATSLLGFRIPRDVDKTLEALAAMLVVALGVNVLRQALRSVRVHRHEHSHSGRLHRHLHVHLGSGASHTHLHAIGNGTRPLLMGALHGLAGSAALLLLVLATMPSTLATLLYVAVFGVGSTVGMVVVSGLVGIPFAAGRSSERARIGLQIGLGAASLGIGIAMLRSLATS